MPAWSAAQFVEPQPHSGAAKGLQRAPNLAHEFAGRGHANTQVHGAEEPTAEVRGAVAAVDAPPLRSACRQLRARQCVVACNKGEQAPGEAPVGNDLGPALREGIVALSPGRGVSRGRLAQAQAQRQDQQGPLEPVDRNLVDEVGDAVEYALTIQCLAMPQGELGQVQPQKQAVLVVHYGKEV